MALTPKQRQLLKVAHARDPVVRVGKAGVSSAAAVVIGPRD
jgi:RNA-binding protein YhbY